MPTIILTDEAHNAIRSVASEVFRATGTRLPDGRWSVQIKPITYFKIKGEANPGESMSDTVLRMIKETTTTIANDSRLPHLIRLNADPKNFEFIGQSDHVDVSSGTERFVTLMTTDLEELIGHPVSVGVDGKPDNLTVRDIELLGAAMAIREYINGLPNIEKRTQTDLLRRIHARLGAGDTIEQACEAIRVDLTKATIEAQIDGLSARDQRRFLRQMRKANRKERREVERNIRSLDEEKAWATKTKDAYGELLEWLDAPLVLQKPPATMFHQLRQAVIDDEALIAAQLNNPIEPADYEECWRDAAVFVVEHDWAAAFDKGQDYEGGEFKLPDETCVFEFRIGGRHVIAVTFEMDNRLYMQPIILTSFGWLIPATVHYMVDGRWEAERVSKLSDFDKGSALLDLLGRQIKAITIALDAEVATSEIVRAPHKLNHAREKRGKLPVSSYHVVSLARRSRAPRLPGDGGEPTYHVRLHFRRGHWRHYENHKTWIKWMLVGDPDLGFVDKHYKL